jgi:hypothetical protein
MMPFQESKVLLFFFLTSIVVRSRYIHTLKTRHTVISGGASVMAVGKTQQPIMSSFLTTARFVLPDLMLYRPGFTETFFPGLLASTVL